MPNTSLGIFIDGKRVFVALLRKEKKQILIEALENYTLVNTYDEPLDSDTFENADQEGKIIDPFADNAQQPSGQDFDEDQIISSEETNIDILQRILADMASKGAHLAINIAVSKQIYSTQRLEKSGKNFGLKKEIKAKLAQERQLEVALENIGFYKRSDDNYFIIGHSDPLAITADFLDMGEYLRKEAIKLSFIDTVEFALAHEINNTYPPEKTGHTCVIFFSDSYTLIFFMQNGEIEFVIPAISEGIESDKACQTALSRIMFEIDSGRIAPIDTLVLSGEVSRHNAVNFFNDNLNDVHIIQYLPEETEFSSTFKGHTTRATLFAPAIAMARKVMNRKKLEIYKYNYLPSYVRDRQSIYNLGIASYVLLIMLFAGAFYLTAQFFTMQNKIRIENQTSTQLDMRLAAMANTAATVDSLRAEITNLEKSTALIDSLTQGSIIWSNYLQNLSEGYSEVGNFALTNIENTGMEKLVYDINLTKRTDVVQIERFLDNCFVKSVAEDESGKYLTVRYECMVTPGIAKKE